MTENLKGITCSIDDIELQKDLWSKKLSKIGINPEDVDMDYLATCVYDDFAINVVAENENGNQISTSVVPQSDEEIKSIIKRRYMKKDPFINKLREAKNDGFDYPVFNRKALLEELAKNKMIVCEDPDNYIDHGDWIELIKPIGTLHIIEKYAAPGKFDWDDACQYAKELTIGGFHLWRIPNILELKAIYAIKDICGIKEYRSSFYDFWWSSSSHDGFSRSHAWSISFAKGLVRHRGKWRETFLRCVI